MHDVITDEPHAQHQRHGEEERAPPEHGQLFVMRSHGAPYGEPKRGAPDDKVKRMQGVT